MRTIGRREPRREDAALVRGSAQFASDHRPPGLLHLHVVRSYLPHARVQGVDMAAARAQPGVIAAWAAADLPSLAALGSFLIPGLNLRPRPVLAAAETRYVGEPLAVVVAEDAYLAADAAALAEADLEPLPATASASEGEAAGAVEREFGDVDAAFARPAVVVEGRFELERVSGGYLEPRAVTAEPEGAGVRVQTSTQTVFGVRDALAAGLGLDPDQVRVLAPAVGGAFGAKGMPYPEEVLTALAALRLGRPVGWTATRSEDTLATAQSHGTQLELALAADADGRLRGLRGRIVHPIGAYAATGPGQADNIASHLISAYRLPALRIRVELVYTNTVPTGFIRGGGREVGNFGIERLVDRLARSLGLDPVEVRRRNLVRPDQMPHDTGYRSPRGVYTFDGGDYPALLDAVAARLDGDALRARGREIGVGITCFTESTGMGQTELCRLRMAPDGQVTAFVGTTPQGQGHGTVGAQVAAEVLGWPLERVRIVAGDSAGVETGRNTAASRSAVEMGNAVGEAARRLREALLELASDRLESPVAEVTLGPDAVGLRGVPEARVPLAELIPAGLEAAGAYEPEGRRAYASGCAGAAVAVDVETGHVRLERYVFAHDVGRAINPTIVEGQMQGGFAHGLGYALFEEMLFEADANPRTSSFLDYTIPGAPDVVPEPELIHHDVPSLHNPLGFRGAGEGGTIPVPAALAAAVEDSLRRQGVDVFVSRLPVTPARIRELVTSSAAPGLAKGGNG